MHVHPYNYINFRFDLCASFWPHLQRPRTCLFELFKCSLNWKFKLNAKLTIWTRKRLVRCDCVQQHHQQQRQQSGQPMRIGCRRLDHVADLMPIKVEWGSLQEEYQKHVVKFKNLFLNTINSKK